MGKRSNESTIGIVGLGMMGRPMARLLVKAGYVVRGFDIDSSNLSEAEKDGILPAKSIANLVTNCGILLLMLPNSQVVESVVDETLAVVGTRVVTIIDMSSSVPTRTRQVHELLASKRLEFLDAPVSGGVARAYSGKLTIMVGGEADAAARMEPVLSVLGAVTYVGPSGSGHATKALNNLLSATHFLASNAATVAAAKLGIDPAVFLRVVNGSSGRSGSTEAKLPNFVLNGAFNSGFSAALMQKDIAIGTSLLEELGLSSPVTSGVLDEWVRLNAELKPGADHTEIIRPIERKAQVELRTTSDRAGRLNARPA